MAKTSLAADERAGFGLVPVLAAELRAEDRPLARRERRAEDDAGDEAADVGHVVDASRLARDLLVRVFFHTGT